MSSTAAIAVLSPWYDREAVSAKTTTMLQSTSSSSSSSSLSSSDRRVSSSELSMSPSATLLEFHCRGGAYGDSGTVCSRRRYSRSGLHLRFCLAVCIVLLSSSKYFSNADEVTHKYNGMENVVVWVDKVGPVYNPQEVYPSTDVPICELSGSIEPSSNSNVVFNTTDRPQNRWNIVDWFEDHHYIRSQTVKVAFGVDVETTPICEMTLNNWQAATLAEMINQDYQVSYYIDDLPVSYYLGSVDEGEVQQQPGGALLPSYVYVDKLISFARNNNQIVSVDIYTSNPIEVKENAKLEFNYSVRWSTTETPYRYRYERYRTDGSVFDKRVHIFSIVNGVALCILLCIVVISILLRTLRNDILRYDASDVDELESLGRVDDSGWKQVHGDVFRRPPRLTLLSVIIACGVHVGTMALCTMFLALANSYQAQKGLTASAAVLCYAATQFVNGAAGGYTFRLYAGKGWMRAMVLQLVTIPVLAGVLFSTTWVSSVAYRHSIALSFNRSFITLLVLFSFVCLPLHLVGTRWGRSVAASKSFPCRIHSLKRPIPPKTPGFLPFMVAGGGLVAFGCVFIEVYFLFNSFWSANKFFFVYGFLLVILLLFTLVLVCVSITSSYLLLNSEDYRWPWICLACCGSTAAYVFISALYYLKTTHMTGMLQLVHFLGGTVFFCFCVFSYCGAVAFFGSLIFVKLIYRNIKSD